LVSDQIDTTNQEHTEPGEVQLASTSEPAALAAPAVRPKAKNHGAQAETFLPIEQMGKLLETVNSVFLRFGFKKESNNPADDDSVIRLPSHGLLQVRYVREGGTSIVAHYVQMQNNLVVYAAEDGLDTTPGMVSVQLGMSAKTVQAKVDSLLIYPIAYRCCVPALSNVPADLILNFLVNLAVPTISALGCASRVFSTKVFENDELWWQVLSAFPPSDRQRAVMASLADIDSPAGTYRRTVKNLVEQQRAEQAAVKRQKRMEEEMRSRFQPPHPHPDFMPYPPGGFPAGFPGGIPGGFPGGMPMPGIVGGDYDLTPGVGFMGNRGQRPGPGGIPGMIGGDYDMFPGGYGGMGRGPMGGGRNPFGGSGMFNGGGSNGMFNGGF